MEQRFCECGCGTITPMAKRTDKRWGTIKGKPLRFAPYHQPMGEKSPVWKGGGYYSLRQGFVVLNPKRQRNRMYISEHLLLAEKILGKSIPIGVVIHHPNGNKDNSIFIICENQGYHILLHQRTRAFKACGHASWRKCAYCKKYDVLENLSRCVHNFFHRTCHNEYLKNYRLGIRIKIKEDL